MFLLYKVVENAAQRHANSKYEVVKWHVNSASDAEKSVFQWCPDFPKRRQVASYYVLKGMGKDKRCKCNEVPLKSEQTHLESALVSREPRFISYSVVQLQ